MEFWNRDLPNMLEEEASGRDAVHLLRPSPPPLPPPMSENDWTHDIFYPDGPPPPFLFTETPSTDAQGHADHPNDGDEEGGAAGSDASGPLLMGGASSILRLTVVLGVLFLFINLVAFSAIYYQRKKLRAQERRALSSLGLRPADGTAPSETDARKPWVLSQHDEHPDASARVREWIDHDVSADNFSESVQDSPPKLGLYPARSSASIVLNTSPRNSTGAEAPPKVHTPVTFRDINVTSLDERTVGNVMVVDALDTMRRKKYPRVLPSEPVPPGIMKRRSLPAFGQLMQPPAQFQDGTAHKVPPPPPPRTSQLSRSNSTESAAARVVTQPRVVVKPSVLPRRPSDRTPRIETPTAAESPSPENSDTSTGTVKHVKFDPKISTSPS